MKPFTYLVKCIPTNQVYYGVRYASNCHPDQLWNTYFTSSKRVHALIEQYGTENFQFQVRKTFSTAEEAVRWETKVLSRLNAAESDIWLNCQNGDYNFKNKGGYKLPESKKTNFRKPKSDSHKQSMKDRYKIKHRHYNDGKRSYYLPEDSSLISELNLKEGQVVTKCPHCSKEGKLNAMLRWHFNNCKTSAEKVLQ